MATWDDILGNRLNLGKLWLHQDQETRLAAAEALYAHDWEDDGAKHAQADALVASALRFRPVAVRKLPVGRRARSLALSTRPGPELAASLLSAYHFAHRVPLMTQFLDALEIPHKDGLIDPEYEVHLTDQSRLSQATGSLYEKHPPEQVDLYLATLYLADRKTWGLIGTVMQERLSKQSSPQS